jgi:hypothetical protein
MHIQDVHECLGAEYAVWRIVEISGFLMLGFFWGHIPKGPGGYHVVEMGCVSEHVVPIRVGESCMMLHW